MHANPPPSAVRLIPPEILLLAYRSGVFPMADSREDEEVFWVEPRHRAIFPLDGFRVSRSLAKVLKQDRFEISVDRDFAAVIHACAQPRTDHPETWISDVIDASYRNLHRQGHAHSVECWRDGVLVGGLYGVAFDRVFCGESMFSREDNASKVALAALVALMRRAGYTLLDCQFMTDHLASLGAVQVSRERYQDLLAKACEARPECSLPQALEALRAQAQASVSASVSASGSDVASGAAAGAAAGADSRSVAPSSPGKLIAQSFIHTS